MSEFASTNVTNENDSSDHESNDGFYNYYPKIEKYLGPTARDEIGPEYCLVLTFLGWQLTDDLFGNLVCSLPEGFKSNNTDWNVAKYSYDELNLQVVENLFYSDGRINVESDGRKCIYISSLVQFGNIFGVQCDFQRDIIIFRRNCSTKDKLSSIDMWPHKGINIFEYDIIVN